MPDYRLSLEFTAADDRQAQRLGHAWAGTCAAEYGTRNPIVTPAEAKREGCDDPDCIRTECLHLGTCWEDEFWGDALDAPSGAHSPASGRTDVPRHTETTREAGEAQEAAE